MTHRIWKSTSLMGMMVFLTGCSRIGEKTASLSIVYGAMAVLSFLLLIGCLRLLPRKDGWFVLLFTSVSVVNTGYFWLSVSRSLQEALMANRLAYLGSVFLPLAMLMILFRTIWVQCRKWVVGCLLGLGIFVFLVAASPGILGIYYKEVSFGVVNGVSMLQKVYGPWHKLYLFYLIGYSGGMIAVVVHALSKSKIYSPVQTTMLTAAVFANIGVWLLEQLVNIEFELLSVSYILTELFLLGLHLMMLENNSLRERISDREEKLTQSVAPTQQIPDAVSEQFLAGVALLTKTERAIYHCYLEGKGTKEILEQMNIKENTLKFHNKNLYGKLGVSSRKQILEIYRQLPEDKKLDSGA